MGSGRGAFVLKGAYYFNRALYVTTSKITAYVTLRTKMQHTLLCTKYSIVCFTSYKNTKFFAPILLMPEFFFKIFGSFLILFPDFLPSENFNK